MNKGIIYYSDCELGEPIFSKVQEYILRANLPVVSCTLKPVNFGINIVIPGKRGYQTYMNQIKTVLEASNSKYVFFCEHDVLYPKSHFYFVPPRDDVFYYNSNVWRWLYGSYTAVTYDRLISLSGLCVNREFALDHYKKRIKTMEEMENYDWKSREPEFARRWGYEPGTKKTRRGGYSNDDYDIWRSLDPIIDIRHPGTFSKTKVTLDSFKHKPVNWREIPIEQLNGWKLWEIFKW